MDNHNAALWCWMKEIDLKEKYNILHVDRHYDTLFSHIDEWVEKIPYNFNEISIQEYLSLKYKDPNFGDKIEIMRWDNYLPIFHKLYKNNIKKYYFFTHKEGSMYDEMQSLIEENPVGGLFNLMDCLFDKDISGSEKWIVNIDLDYFFQKIDDTDITIRFISDEAIEFFINKINEYNNKGSIKVITFALSPECCGNWDNSLKLMNFIAEKLKIDFKIK